MNIFFRELKANRKSLIVWSACLVLFFLAGMSKFTAYSAGGPSSEVLNKLPKAMRELLGMGSFDVTNMSGFYAFLFTYTDIIIAIHAVLLGNSIIAKEERDKTTEFLIAKPVSRFTVITAKFLAALVNIIIVNLAILLSSLAVIPAFNKGESITGEVIVLMVDLFIIQLIFLSLGTIMAAAMRKPKGSGGIAVGILLAGYVIAKVTDVSDKLNALNVLSPFKYFNLTDIVNKNSLNAVILILSLVLTAVLVFLTYYFYTRRDLNI